MPRLGPGTWLVDPAETAQAVGAALNLGYRHIDTAQAYGSEAGAGIRAYALPGEAVFVASKIAAKHKNFRSAADSIDASLQAAGLDYLDLMLIHSPQLWSMVNQSDGRCFAKNRAVWQAMEDAYRAGKVRATGVSNFLREDLESLF